MLLSLLFALALSAAPSPSEPAPATPSAGATPATPAAKPVTEAKNDMVCRKEQVTGSRFTRTLCAHKGDFEKRSANDQQVVRERQRFGYNCRTNNVGC